jgi:hypothetical protein
LPAARREIVAPDLCGTMTILSSLLPLALRGIFPLRIDRRWIACAVFASCAMLLGAAAEDPARPFDIPAGPAAVSLRKFSAQAAVQLVFPTDLVAGVRTNPVHGRFTPLYALDRMLLGTGLAAFREPTTGALGIRRAEQERKPTVGDMPAR